MKVYLRPFEVTDITDNYVGWLNDPAVVRFSNQRFLKHDKQSCQNYFASFSGTANLFYCVCRTEDDAVIGTMTVYRSLPHGTADVGILIGDPSSWGGGFGRDAWCTIMNGLSEMADIRKITAGTLSCNVGMVRLMEVSGMEHEATRTGQEIVEGAEQDIVYYAKFPNR